MGEHSGADRPDGIAFAGRRFRVRLQTLPHALGGVRQFEIVETPAAAAAVPVLLGPPAEEPMVLLVEQERPAIGGRTLEIPAGLLRANPSEEPSETAARELREETGYRAGTLRPLTSIYTSPGITDEIVHIFLATDLTLDGAVASPDDPTEIAGVRRIALREAVGMAARGEIRDAKTTIGLLLVGAMLSRAASHTSQAPDTGGGSDMPFDASNVPQSMLGSPPARPASERGGPDPTGLTLENILTQEFGYANVTAYQAMEDRARIFNLYLLLVGVLASALTAVYQLGIKDYVLPLTFMLLLLAGFLGVVFFMQIIRLRQAFRDSVITMNRIKEYYIKHLVPQIPDAATAFHWRLRSIPRGERLGSVTFLISFTIAFLASLCLAGAFVVGAQYLRTQNALDASLLGTDTTIYLLALVVLVLALLLHTLYYRRKLSKKADDRIVKVEEAIIGSSTQD
jgi:ADP-ribose pyrophosphatase